MLIVKLTIKTCISYCQQNNWNAVKDKGKVVNLISLFLWMKMAQLRIHGYLEQARVVD